MKYEGTMVGYDQSRKFLNLLLVSTITPETSIIPSSEKTILTTLTEAVLKYAENETHPMQNFYGEYSLNRERKIVFSEEAIYEVLVAALSKAEGKINPETQQTLKSLTEPYWTNPDPRDHAEVTCQLYEMLKGFASVRPLGTFTPTFSPTYDWVQRRKKELAELPEAQRKDIEGISKLLREIWQEMFR